MTKEVAEKIVRGITDKIECNTVDIDDWAEFWGFTREEYEKFLDMAIKALEQTKWNPASENFFQWLALEIMQSDEDFKDNSEAFQEMCCRKLIELGIIKKETEDGRIIYSLEDFTNEE